MGPAREERRVQSLSKSWRVLHWLIIINFAVEMVYASHMVFFVLSDGLNGPALERGEDHAL